MADNSLEGFSPEEIAQMATTYKGLLENPETRELTLRGTKKLNPRASIPEIDLKDAALGAFKKQADDMESLKADIRKRDAADRVREEREKLRDAGYSKDQVAAIEKIMIDEHIPSYDTAARYFKAQTQAAEPTPHSTAPATTYSMPADAMTALKGGKAGLNKFARESATAALDEIRSGRIKLH